MKCSTGRGFSIAILVLNNVLGHAGDHITALPTCDRTVASALGDDIGRKERSLDPIRDLLAVVIICQGWWQVKSLLSVWRERALRSRVPIWQGER